MAAEPNPDRDPDRSPDRDASAPPPERRLATGVVQLSLASATLPPFDRTWVTLLVSRGRAALVDPGFEDPADADRLIAWAHGHGARDLDTVLLTHTHRDHVDGLPALLARLPDATVFVHPVEAERVPGAATIRPLGDGRRLVLAGLTVRATHTPGHAPGHLAFVVEDGSGELGVVAGDLVTGRGAAWVGLPEGDAAAYLASLERIRALRPRWLSVAHGAAVDDPVAALDAAIAHRRAREQALLAALTTPRTSSELIDRVYGEVPEAVRGRVRTSLLAMLVKTVRDGEVELLGRDEEGPYRRVAARL